MHITYTLIVFFLALIAKVGCTTPLLPVPSLTRMPPKEGVAKFGLDMIGGEEVPAGHKDYDSIVRINTNGSMCTASLVGPRAIMTAGHCGKSGQKAFFSIQGKQYEAVLTRHPVYPQVDLDFSLGLISEAVEGVAYEQIDSFEASLEVGSPVLLYGYGCTQKGGGGGNDGILRKGGSAIISFSSKDFVTKKPQGAALCFGDSGGPSFRETEGQRLQVGVASKGNISDTSYFANLSLAESRDFIKKWADENAVDVCGVTKDCLVPPGPAPSEIVVTSEELGELKMTLSADTLDPQYVEHHMKMLMDFLELAHEQKPEESK